MNAPDSTYLNSRFERVAKVGQRRFEIYRYDPDRDERPRMQQLTLDLDGSERMLLDNALGPRVVVLVHQHELDGVVWPKLAQQLPAHPMSLP